MKRRILSLLAGLSLLLTFDAYACSCIGGRPVDELLSQAEGAFIGTVTESTKSSLVHTYTFRVETTFKGKARDTVEVETASHSATCGTTFEENKSYLVFLTSRQGKYKTGLCSGNKEAASITEEEMKSLKR